MVFEIARMFALSSVCHGLLLSAVEVSTVHGLKRRPGHERYIVAPSEYTSDAINLRWIKPAPAA